jgi:hypothetical protein
MEAVGAAGSVVGLVSLAIQVMGLSVTVKDYVQSLKGANEERKAFIKEMESLQPLLEIIKEHTNVEEWNQNAGEIAKTLGLLQDVLEELKNQVDPHKRLELKHKIVWVWKVPKIQEIVWNIRGHIQTVQFLIAEDHFVMSKDTNA